ncbi:MAG: single-stranded DNA-binding protein [Bacteroidota bacterium]
MSYFKNSKNTSHFIGRLGSDVVAENKASKSIKFSIATNLIMGKDDKKKEKTIWVPCQIWADNPAVKYMTSGKMVAIDAYYDNATVGQGQDKKYFHHFQVENVVLLGSSDSEEGKEEAKSA